MFRWKWIVCCLCVGAMPAAAYAGDPLVGTWKLDTAKSKNIEPMTPQMDVVTAEPGGYKFHEVAKMGVAQQTDDMDVLPDGKPHTTQVQDSKLTQVFTRTGTRTIEVASSADGQPIGSATIVLSADGKTLSITEIAAPGSNTPPLVRVYDKQ